MTPPKGVRRFVCEYCLQTFEIEGVGGPLPRYCCRNHLNRARHERRTQNRKSDE